MQTERRKEVFYLMFLAFAKNTLVSKWDKWNMHTEHFWNDNDRGKTEVLGEKPVQASLLLPQFPYWMAWHQTQASKCDRPAINVGEREKGAHKMSETAHMRKSPVQNLSHHIHLNIRWPPSTVFILSGICLLHRTYLPLCRITRQLYIIQLMK